jgi:hypothetical protein
MNAIVLGMLVYGVDDHLLGSVSRVRACCIEIALNHSAGSYFLTPAAVFNVDTRVTLMCVNSEVSRYACPIHQPKATVGEVGA